MTVRKTTANSTLASVFFEEKKPNAKLQNVSGNPKKNRTK